MASPGLAVVHDPGIPAQRLLVGVLDLDVQNYSNEIDVQNPAMHLEARVGTPLCI